MKRIQKILSQRKNISYLISGISLMILTLAFSGSCSNEQTAQANSINFITPSPVSTEEITRLTDNIKTAMGEPDADGTELLGVKTDDEISVITISFKAPVKLTANWWQGSVYIIDEKNNCIYKEIPVLPIIGPLIGKPAYEGQIGYFMLSNYDKGIKPGSVVTVVLGKYKREHIKVQ